MLLLVVGIEFIDFRDAPETQLTMLIIAWLTAGVTTSFLMVLVIAERSQRALVERSAALDAERRALDGMIEAVPAGILLTDPHGRIERLNQVLRRQLGISGDADHWRGRLARETLLACREDLIPADRTALEEDLSLCALDRPVPPRPLELRFLDGRVLSVSVHAVTADDGSYRGRVWVSRSVGEERRIAEEIQRAERMQTVGTLAGGLAHDFNNQLTAIIGGASLLIDSPGSRCFGSRAAERADRCRRTLCGSDGWSCWRLHGASPRRPGPVAVAAVVDRVVALMRPALPPNVEIQARIPREVGAVHADEFPAAAGAHEPARQCPQRRRRARIDHAHGTTGRGPGRNRGERRRSRDGRGHPAAGLRPVLHDETSRRRNGARTRRGVRDRRCSRGDQSKWRASRGRGRPFAWRWPSDPSARC